jgi:hypothetical protein
MAVDEKGAEPPEWIRSGDVESILLVSAVLVTVIGGLLWVVTIAALTSRGQPNCTTWFCDADGSFDHATGRTMIAPSVIAGALSLGLWIGWHRTREARLKMIRTAMS